MVLQFILLLTIAAASVPFSLFEAGGCSKEPAYTPGMLQNITLRHEEHLRDYLLYIPSTYNSTVATPVVFGFAGYDNDASTVVYDDGWQAVAEQNNFILLVLNGANDDGADGWRSFNAGGCNMPHLGEGPTCTKKCDWDKSYCFDSCNCKRCVWCTCLDDVGLVVNLLNKLKTQFCIDSKKVYATGFSNGAIMAYELAIKQSHLFAAVAPVEGSVMLGYYKTLHRKHTVPVSVLDVHGISDTTIPSNHSLSDDFWRYETTHSNLEHFKKVNNCTGDGDHWPTSYEGSAGLWCKKEADRCH